MSVTVLDLPRRQRSAAQAFQLEVFDGGNFAACDWPAIADSRDLNMYVFQSREFLEVWTRNIGKANGSKTYLLVVRRGSGEPVLYLPLAIETKFNIRLLRFMDGGVADYNAPVLKAGLSLSRQEFNALWADALTLLPDVDVIDLKKIAADVMGAVNPLTYLGCTRHGDDGHLLLLKGTDAGSGSVISAGQRRKLDREYRKLGKSGAVEFVVNPESDLAAAVTEKLFALKRQKYAGTNSPDFLAVPGVADFYRRIAGTGIGHLSALLNGRRVLSAHLGYAGRGRFYYILPAYDPAYARYRPGYLLLRELIGLSAQNGHEAFDFGFGDEPYKQAWVNHRLSLHDHEQAMTAAGRLYLHMRRARRFVKSAGVRTWFRSGG